MNDEVTIIYDGMEYTGEYIVDENMITVFFDDAEKCTQVDNFLHQELNLAKILLRKLVIENLKSGRL